MLLNQLEELAQSDHYPFHMPGHKRMLDFPNPYAVDITEIEGFDNLHHAQGVIRDAQARAARLYGSKRAYYLVNGSTCGILAAISAAVPRGSRILIARNSHKAVYHAVYLRQLSAEYVYPVDTVSGIQGQITVQQIEEHLAENPSIQAVVITSPTYDGLVSDVASIAAAVHQHNIPLIVDEAHGAHFGFHPVFPENATRLGADAVIMSVHKTLPAFTQTALLHLCSDRIDPARVEKFLDIYETSSPSYLLMAGIERSLALIEDEGYILFRSYMDRLADFTEKMRLLQHLTLIDGNRFTSKEAYGFDPGKLLIATNGVMSGRKLQEFLHKCYNLDLEMAGLHYVTAMTSIMDTQEGFDRLAQALQAVDRSLGEKAQNSQKSAISCGKSDVVPTSRDIYRAPEKRAEIYEAEEASVMILPLRAAVGHTSATYISLYPPGIPIIVPGEILDEQTVGTVIECLKLGYEVEGLERNSVSNVSDGQDSTKIEDKENTAKFLDERQNNTKSDFILVRVVKESGFKETITK